MSWKSRKRKAILRYIELLKELPIYLIDQYIIIDESVYYYKKNRMHVNYKAVMRKEYEKYLADGKIKSSFDFDNYFNPDLTLDVPFEKNESRANILIKNKLMQIGKRWHQRLKSQFPKHHYTLVMYFISEDLEWYLDFYNGVVKIEELDPSERCANIIYL